MKWFKASFMTNVRLGCSLLLVFMSLAPLTAIASDMARVTIKVIDEDGKPVDAAKVAIHFQGGSLAKDAIRGVTDKEGAFSASGSSLDGTVAGGTVKDGYYSSTFHHQFYITKLGQWQPWDKEMTVVLRQKVNPVPMYVRNQKKSIPFINKEIGFDLVKSDWVIPYGTGTHSDFIFCVERKYKDYDNFDATLTLTFPNKYDGIQLVKDDLGGDFSLGSRYRLPREAPESGYEQKLVKRHSMGTFGERRTRTNDNNYIFRVRSELDEEGKFKRAMYGKIRGELIVEPRNSNTAKIYMFYYLNPDYTRNLEFDFNRNLFSPLPNGEYPIGLP